MNMLKTGLILLSLTFIVSCCKPIKEIEYIDRVEYRTPIVSKPIETNVPAWDIRINGDLLRYRAQCEAQIKNCNIDKKTIYNQSQGIE